MPKKDYNALERFTHRIALGGNVVGDAVFDIEKSLYGPKQTSETSEGRHVFIAGLARAGTTILLRQLYDTGEFRSLTYRDMPFVLAPNLWRRLTGASRKAAGAQERAHGDGMLVDYDSPEALEEVFCRVKCRGEYIGPNSLHPIVINSEVITEYIQYVAIVLSSDPDKRYLAKNNNNLLRLEVLEEAFPNSNIIIPFREPLQQAYSLMRQHRLFLDRHRTDPFAQKYMVWLAHHEFGRDHKPFAFDGDDSSTLPVGDAETNLGYWLKQWISAYAFASRVAPSNAIFLSYERLCDPSATVWKSLCAKLGLPTVASTGFHAAIHSIDADLPDGLVDEAVALHQALLERGEG